MTVYDDAAQTFTESFGGEPDGVWCAPGRVNLIGEHVDYAGGLCLPIALEQITAAAVRRRSDGRVRMVSTGFDRVETDLSSLRGRARPSGWAAYVAGVLYALDPPGCAGLDIAISSDVTVGSGLSSSAALEAAVALAVAEMYGLPTDDAGRDRLAGACVVAENEYVGAPTGGMDQQIALRGRAGHALLLDCADGSVEHVPFDPAAHDMTILVVDTRTAHRLVDGQYGERRRAVEDATRLLGVATLRDASSVDGLDDPVLRRRARHVVTEIDRVRLAADALRTGRIHELGALLDASHRSLRDDFEVSCLELDTAVDAARAAGASGARMVGGGFGGSAIVLCELGRAAAIEAAVADAAARRGLPAPAFLRATPAGAARRCR